MTPAQQAKRGAVAMVEKARDAYYAVSIADPKRHSLLVALSAAIAQAQLIIEVDGDEYTAIQTELLLAEEAA